MAHGFSPWASFAFGNKCLSLGQINGDSTNKKSGQWRDRPLVKITEGTMRPKKWLPQDRRAGFSSGSGPDVPTGWWGSGAINSEPSSDYGNHSARAIER